MKKRNMNECPDFCSDKCSNSTPLAMGYVPWQTFHKTFELKKALQVGTIFPELCKPFCGRRFG